jgi:cytoskeleton protein RodZ
MTEAALPPALEATGTRLRKAREAAGMSLEDVSGKLKLSPRQIAAIEAEDWAELPQAPFTRGFVRNYARLVGIPEETLKLDNLQPISQQSLPPTPTPIGEVASHNNPSGYGGGGFGWLIPLGLLACLVAGAAWFLWRDTPMPLANNKLPMASAAEKAANTAANAASSASSVVAPTLSAPAVLNVPSPTNNAAPPPATTNAPAPTSTNIGNTSSAPATLLPALPNTSTTPAAPQPGAPSVPSTVTSPVATPLTSAAPTTVTTPTAAPAPASPQPVTNGKERALALSYAGRSWTEIRSNGEVVFSETVSSGSREVRAALPLSFVIGGAGSVKLSIDGKPYDFSQSVRSEVARFRIDRID